MATKDKQEFFKVESGIPIPPQRSYFAPRNSLKRSVYPYAEMMVGDSFLVPKGISQGRVSGTAVAWAKRHKLPWKFAVRRMVDGNTRCWRIK